ncbi:MAG: RHS repeat-associated core domain-containing protein [Opitutales bacterium]
MAWPPHSKVRRCRTARLIGRKRRHPRCPGRTRSGLGAADLRACGPVRLSLNPFRYSTKVYDNDIGQGLYDYGLRYYSPALQRFLTRDPIREAGGLNLYRFAANNPVNYFDRYGLTPFVIDPAQPPDVFVNQGQGYQTAPGVGIGLPGEFDDLAVAPGTPQMDAVAAMASAAKQSALEDARKAENRQHNRRFGEKYILTDEERRRYNRLMGRAREVLTRERRERKGRKKRVSPIYHVFCCFSCLI